MAKAKRSSKRHLYSRRFYVFEDKGFLQQQIEEVRENVQFSTLAPKYAWIIHKAIIAMSFNKEYQTKGFTLRKKANPILLKQDPSVRLGTLSYLFGGSDKAIKEIIYSLVEWRVIKVHKKYFPGERATTYKLTEEWEKKPITMRRLYGKKGSVIYKLNQRWNERMKHPIVKATQWIYDQYVTLSEEGIRFVQQRYTDSRIDAVAEALRNGTFEDNKEALQDSLNGFPVEPADVVLMSFFIRDLYCSPVGKGKRLYHSITNLKREYRCFVLLDGKPIQEVDIRNSQPSFAAAFLIRLARREFPGEAVPNDLLFMMDLCRRGQFYERIAQEAGIVLTEENRGTFKKDFFEQVFYARVTKSIRKLKTAFQALFPTAFIMINSIKQRDHKWFPVIMQDLEADIMVYEVYKTLLEENYVVLVLHDAILCSTPEAVQRSKELIRQSFRDTFGEDITFKGE